MLEAPAGAGKRARLGWCVLAAALFAAGCGSPGAPAPPSLDLPAVVTDLSAIRVGEAVQLTWTMPPQTTDGIALKRPVRTEICRETGTGPCTTVATTVFPPGKPAIYVDRLPADLAGGASRMLTYQVTLRNHAHKSAGPSNPAFSASGAAPAALTGLTADMRPNGVLLSWHPSAAGIGAAASPEAAIDFRIDRVLESPSTQAQETILSVPEPTQQTLVVHAGSGPDPGHALDASAQFNRQYRYTVQRVASMSLRGRRVEIQGQPSEPMSITTKDIFPPAVPRDLAAVADAAAGAIDLSWTPDTSPNLAGYYLYRRDVASGSPAGRISPPSSPNSPQSPIESPAFRDATVERGHTYAYSVSAVSQAGFESRPSPEVVETFSTQ